MARNKYVGTWTEPVSHKIDLPFNIANARKVIAWGASVGAPYSHQDIAHWCERFWNIYCDIDDVPPEIGKILPVLADVETQWDLFLANSYSLTELQSINFANIALPKEWFRKWLAKIGT